jgi:hypothetical protein
LNDYVSLGRQSVDALTKERDSLARRVDPACSSFLVGAADPPLCPRRAKDSNGRVLSALASSLAANGAQLEQRTAQLSQTEKELQAVRSKLRARRAVVDHLATRASYVPRKPSSIPLSLVASLTLPSHPVTGQTRQPKALGQTTRRPGAVNSPCLRHR